MNLEQFDFIVRYDEMFGITHADKASMNYADEMVKTERFDITVGSEFLLTAFRYSMKQNGIDPSRMIFVVPYTDYHGGELKYSTVLIDQYYNYAHGLEGRFDHPDYNCQMLIELF